MQVQSNRGSSVSSLPGQHGPSTENTRQTSPRVHNLDVSPANHDYGCPSVSDTGTGIDARLPFAAVTRR